MAVHLCTQANQFTWEKVKSAITGRLRKSDPFYCGDCPKTFDTICNLHLHCIKHSGGSSYFFDHVTNTAYPKFDARCSFTQFEEDDQENNNGDCIVLYCQPRNINEVGAGNTDDLELSPEDQVEAQDRFQDPPVSESVNHEKAVPDEEDVRANETIIVKNLERREDGSLSFEMDSMDYHLSNAAAMAIDQHIQKEGQDWLNMALQLPFLTLELGNIQKPSGVSKQTESPKINEKSLHVINDVSSTSQLLATAPSNTTESSDMIEPSFETVKESPNSMAAISENKEETSNNVGASSDNMQAIHDKIVSSSENKISNVENIEASQENIVLNHQSTKASFNDITASPNNIEITPEKTIGLPDSKDCNVDIDNMGESMAADNDPADSKCVRHGNNLPHTGDTEDSHPSNQNRRPLRNRKLTSKLKESELSKDLKTYKGTGLKSLHTVLTGISHESRRSHRNNLPVNQASTKPCANETTVKSDIDSTIQTVYNQQHENGQSKRLKQSANKKPKLQEAYETASQALLSLCSTGETSEASDKTKTAETALLKSSSEATETDLVKSRSVKSQGSSTKFDSGSEDNGEQSIMENADSKIGDDLLSLRKSSQDLTNDGSENSRKEIEGDRRCIIEDDIEKPDNVQTEISADDSDSINIENQAACDTDNEIDSKSVEEYKRKSQRKSKKTRKSSPRKKCKNLGKSENENTELGVSSKDAISRPKKVGSKRSGTQATCPTCGKVGTSQMVSYHRQMHSGNLEYSCNVCGKMYATKPALRDHMLRHGEKKWKCPHCPEAFFRREYMETHIRKHTGENPFSFICDLCGEGFKAKYILKRHVNSVHKQIRNFDCDICGEKFFRADTRDGHRARHFDAFLKCSHCPKKFNGELDLRKHELTHTGEKQFFCPMCTQGFSDLWPYYKHMWKIHGINKEKAKMMRVKNPNIVNMRLKNKQNSLDQNLIKRKLKQSRRGDKVVTKQVKKTGKFATSTNNIQSDSLDGITNRANNDNEPFTCIMEVETEGLQDLPENLDHEATEQIIEYTEYTDGVDADLTNASNRIVFNLPENRVGETIVIETADVECDQQYIMFDNDGCGDSVVILPEASYEHT